MPVLTRDNELESKQDSYKSADHIEFVDAAH